MGWKILIMNDCIKSNLPGFLYTFIMFWNLFFTPALFLGVMGYARFLFLSFVLSQWLMIQGTRESKILAGSGCFVRFSYFMYVTCCRLALFQTFITFLTMITPTSLCFPCRNTREFSLAWWHRKPQGPEEMYLSLEHQNPSKTAEKNGLSMIIL